MKASIGERVKQARRIRGMSQRELAKKTGVSAQAISKYERDKNVPSSGVLLRLSKALDLGIEFFVRPQRVAKITPDYRKRRALPRKMEAAIVAKITDWLERYLEIENILHPDGDVSKFRYPESFPRKVGSMDDVEKAAEDLRQSWDLGSGPIESLINLLEDRGIKVGVIDADDRFDACTFNAEDDAEILIIITRRNMPGDRQRFSVAHELGHLMLEPQDDLDGEKAAQRFAGAFLVPEKRAHFELGYEIRTLSDFELLALKHKYGLSMQAWIYRAKDLGIISEPRASALFKKFRSMGLHKTEPGNPYPSEWPMRFEFLVHLALAEDIISKKRAEELLGKPLQQIPSEPTGKHGGQVAAVCD